MCSNSVVVALIVVAVAVVVFVGTSDRLQVAKFHFKLWDFA